MCFGDSELSPPCSLCCPVSPPGRKIHPPSTHQLAGALCFVLPARGELSPAPPAFLARLSRAAFALGDVFHSHTAQGVGGFFGKMAALNQGKKLFAGLTRIASTKKENVFKAGECFILELDK